MSNDDYRIKYEEVKEKCLLLQVDIKLEEIQLKMYEYINELAEKVAIIQDYIIKVDGLKEEGISFPDSILSKLIRDLELPIRIHNCLKMNDILYIGDLVQKTEEELLRMPHFGRKSLDWVDWGLKKHSLSLDMKHDFQVKSWQEKKGNKND